MQIAEDLKFKINSDKWAVNEKIPTELELCEAYNVSRITIRKSLELLVNEGLLERKRAIGTFVTEKRVKDNLTDYFSQEGQKFGDKTHTIKAMIQKVKSTPKIAQFLDCEPGDNVMNLKRVFGTDDLPFAYFDTYFTLFKNVSENSNDYYDSFYAYLSGMDINPRLVQEYIEAVLPSEEIKEQLHVNPQKPILKRVRQVSQSEKQFKEYSECYYIGDEYRFYVNTPYF